MWIGLKNNIGNHIIEGIWKKGGSGKVILNRFIINSENINISRDLGSNIACNGFL